MRKSSRPSRPDASDGPSGPDAPAVPPDDLEPVGRIADAYGVDGRLKVQPFGAPEDSVLLRCTEWWLRAVGTEPGPVAGAGSGSGLQELRIERARAHGATIVARATSLADREAALRLRGAEVLVSRARFPAPADDEYYWLDLIGCEVRNREGARLGQVASVDDHGAHALLTVRPDAGPVFLVPFVDAYVDRVDLSARRIDVDWQADY